MKNWETLEPDVYKLMNKHYTKGREGRRIDKLVIHHNGGSLTMDQIWQVWQTRQASAHYQVDTAGRIGQLVNDWDTAWQAGTWEANLTSIGIEHAQIPGTGATGPVNDKTLEEGAHLVAALCKAYGLGRPQWWRNMFPHNNFEATQCPGHLHPTGSQGKRYESRAQAWYDAMTGGKPVPQSSQPQPQPATRRLIMPDQTIRDYQGKPVTVEAILARIDAHVRPITRGNRSSELRQEVADTKNIATATQAQVTALTAAIGALSKAQGVDPKLVERAIREAIAEALDGLELTGEIKIGGAE